MVWKVYLVVGATEQRMEGLPCCGGDRAGYGRFTLLWG